MKLIYKPFGIIIGLAAGFVSTKIFNVVWGVFDEQEPPKPTTRDAPTPKLIAAAAVQGIVFKLTRLVVDRTGAKGFAYLTGVWPGDSTAEESQAAKAVR